MLKSIVVAIGAVVIVSAHAITGYRLHRWMLDNAPGLAALIPRDGGAILGIAAGLLAIWWWGW